MLPHCVTCPNTALTLVSIFLEAHWSRRKPHLVRISSQIILNLILIMVSALILLADGTEEMELSVISSRNPLTIRVTCSNLQRYHL